MNQLVVNEWEKRALRKGLRSVMSTRWTPEQCVSATKKLKSDIFSFLPTLTDKIILDVGCGIGRFTSDLLKKSSKVYAIDISPSMILRAKKKLDSKGVKLYKEAAHELHFKDNFFDLIFEVTVLQHIPNSTVFKQTIDELKRVTNKKGFIFLCGEMSKNDEVISPITILRSIKTYLAAMKPWRLLKYKAHRCVTDNYLLTLWKM